MASLIYQWIDLLWLPLAWFAVPKHFRPFALGFIFCSMMTMRLLAETFVSLGYTQGFLPILQAPPFTKGLVVYAIIFTLYLLLAHYSPRTRAVVFMAASLTIYVLSLVICTAVMAI